MIDKIPEESGPQHILDKGYDIRAFDPDADEDPKKDEREAEQTAAEFPFLKR